MATPGWIRTRDWRARKSALTSLLPPEPAAGPLPDPVIPDQPAVALKLWAEDALQVPAGRLRGRPFRLDDWQVDFLSAALAPDTAEAYLSTARKNGKTGLIIALVLGHVTPGSPLHRPGWRGLWVSLTGELAAEGRRQADEIIAVSGLPGVKVRKSPAPGGVVGDRADCKMLAADKSSGHAAGADLAVIDEGGLLPERRRPLWDAISSAVSGRDGRLLAISVQGDGPMFRELRERIGGPGVVGVHHEAPADCALEDEAAWRQANPGLGGIKSLDYMRHRARTAVENPASAAGFRSLDLNQAVAPAVELLCDLEQWRAVESSPGILPPREGRCWLGVDLGGSLSLSAAAALWESGRLDLWAAIPAEPAPLIRGRRDGVGDAYVRAIDSGHLTVCGRRIVDAGRFLAGVFEAMPAADWLMGCDRYRRSELVDVLSALGESPSIRWRGTGASATADGAYDVRAFQAAVALRAFTVAPNPMMRLALAGAAVRRDASGNPALDKSGKDARIDLASAAVIAFGLRAMAREKRERRGFAIAG